MKKHNSYNWNMVFFLSIIPLIGFVGTGVYIYHHGVVWQEPLLLLVFWFLSGMGITMGYHRLFAHKSYETTNFIQWVLMILGSLAFENTILKWSSDHRKHHTHPETENDPYSIKEGFWHAHIGWILKNTPEEKNKIIGVKDLEKKSVVKFQNKYYFHIGILFGMLLPLCIGLLYGRPLGAILWGTFLRITLVHHATFFINSLCHYVGARPYDSNSTARDSWFVSLFTFGEGYHNYHHKFQWDYRNGIKWFAFDPSKWIINFLSYFGFAYNLKKAKEYLIWESRIESIKNQLNDKLSSTTDSIANLYISKVELLYNQSQDIFTIWKELDLKYTKSISVDKLKNKEIIKKLRNINKENINKVKLIKIDLDQILLNIKRGKLVLD